LSGRQVFSDDTLLIPYQNVHKEKKMYDDEETQLRRQEKRRMMQNNGAVIKGGKYGVYTRALPLDELQYQATVKNFHNGQYNTTMINYQRMHVSGSHAHIVSMIIKTANGVISPD
jgi:hypothetical protein